MIFNLNYISDKFIFWNLNKIKHGYLENGNENGEFNVIVEKTENELLTIIEDSAVQYNPLEHVLPTEQDLSTPLEERPIGGLGVMIARQSVDEFKYEFTNNKNRNIFIVKIKE